MTGCSMAAARRPVIAHMVNGSSGKWVRLISRQAFQNWPPEYVSAFAVCMLHSRLELFSALGAHIFSFASYTQPWPVPWYPLSP